MTRTADGYSGRNSSRQKQGGLAAPSDSFRHPPPDNRIVRQDIGTNISCQYSCQDSLHLPSPRPIGMFCASRGVTRLCCAIAAGVKSMAPPAMKNILRVIV